MPLTIHALTEIFKICKKDEIKKAIKAVTLLALLIQVSKGSGHCWKNKYRNNEYKKTGEWINANRDKFVKRIPIRLSGGLETKHLYQPGTDLIIASRKVQTAYWAHADHISLNDIEFTKLGFKKYILDNEVDIVVAEGPKKRMCNDLSLSEVRETSGFQATIYTLKKQYSKKEEDK